MVPPLSPIISISVKVDKQLKVGNRKKAVFYSDVAFGFAYMGLILTIFFIVMAYSFGKFPAHTYYDRDAIITGRTTPNVMATTMAAVMEDTTIAVVEDTTMAAVVQATTAAILQATTSA